MEESHQIDHLLAAKEILKTSIEKSRSIVTAVDKITSNLHEASHSLPFLEDAIRDMASKCTMYKIRRHIDRAIGPASAVLKVLDLVYALEDSLSTDPHASDLNSYLADIKRLKEALDLLANYSNLAILWLEDAVQFLKDNAEADEDEWYHNRVYKVVKILMHLHRKGGLSFHEGGVLCAALDKLERHFRHLMLENSSPLAWDPSFLYYDDETMAFRASSALTDSVVQELQAITEVLAAHDRLERCISIYAEVRISNARASLQELDVSYLEIHMSGTTSVQTVEAHIDQWDKHMMFAVRNMLRTEYRLCTEVYQKVGSDISMNCFAKIADKCGFRMMLDFGNKIANSKKEAIKLLKLLKIFLTLDKLRIDFNDMFGGRFCTEIQNQTRDLVRRVVGGACEIFWELLVQVELQREYSPPDDGSVPPLFCFITEYCNHLLEDENSLVLTRMLEIYQAWSQVKFEDGLLYNEVHNIMKALEINLETWFTRYDDTALSSIFMMNSYWYLTSNLTGTKLGELMGHSWLWAYEKSINQYARMYLRESWERLLVLLGEDGLTLFPNGRAIDSDLVKKRVAMFCDAFDDIYRKQSKWIMPDKALRWKIHQQIIEAVVPPYKSYLERFVHETDMGKHVRYSAGNLEKLIGSLFEQKIGNYSNSNKCTDLIISVTSTDMDHLAFTPAAA